MAVEPRAEERDGADEEPGLLDMLPGESEVLTAPGSGGARFILTNERILYAGGASGGFAAARLSDVVAVKLDRRERDRRSAIWGFIGVLAAVGVWQVTRNETVGAVVGGVVGFIALVLLADYLFRMPGLVLRFVTPGGVVEGEVDNGDADAAEDLAARVESMRQDMALRAWRETVALHYRGYYWPRV